MGADESIDGNVVYRFDVSTNRYLNRFRSVMFLTLKAAERAESLACDWFVIDLQDSVPLPEKDLVRSGWSKCLNQPVFEQRHIVIRVNELDVFEHLTKDLEQCVGPNVDALLLPMLTGAEDVQRYDELVSAVEHRKGLVAGAIKFICLMETPNAVLYAREIATASPRNIALSFGHADLLNLTMGEKSKDSLLVPRAMVVLAARAAQLEVIDSPYFELNDMFGFEQQCQHSKQLGFTGIFVLHPKQLQTANRVFSEKKERVEHAARILSSNKDGCFMDQGTMLGPPFIKQLRKIRERGYYEYAPAPVDERVIGSVVEHTPSLKEIIRRGQFYSPYEVTISDSWSTSWQSLCFSGNPIEYNRLCAQDYALDDIPIPYTLLLSYALCAAVEVLTEKCLVHLSVADARYEEPVYFGDTLRVRISVRGVDSVRNGANAVLTTQHEVLNSRDRVVFSVIKKTLYDKAPDILDAPAPQCGGNDRHETSLAQQILRKPVHDRYRGSPLDESLTAGKLLLHSDIRLLGRTENSQFNSLFRNTLPIHGNYARYREHDIVTCGLLVLPIVLGIAARDLKPFVSQQIDYCYHLNKVHPNMSLGAVSYVQSVRSYNEFYDEVSLRTLGINELDVVNELKGVSFPKSLFVAGFTPPKAIEELCSRFLPHLLGRIALICDWKIYRPK